MALVSSTAVSTVFGSKKDSEKYAVQCTGCPVCFLVKTGNWALQADSLPAELPEKPVSMRMLLNFPFKLSVKHIRDCRIHLSSRDL